MVGELKDKELFQGVFESSVEGILIVDDQGTILMANPAVERMFGYPTGKLIHKKVGALILGEFEIHIKNTIKNSKTITLGQESELWAIKKNGSQFSLDASLSPYLVDGQPLVIAFLRDSTSRMLTNYSLSNSEDKIAEVQHMANIGSWFWDLRTNERGWSDEFYRICGLTPGDEQLNAETFEQFIHPDDLQGTLKAVGYAIENQTPYNYENRIIRPDGNIRNVVGKGKATYNTKGKPIRMMGTIQDITGLNDLKEEFAIIEIRNTAILKAIPDIMFVNNKQGVYLDLHAPYPSMLLMPKDEIIGKSIYDLLPKMICGKIMAAFYNSKKTNTTQIVEYSLPILEQKKYFEARIVAKENGNFLTIIRDVTETKILEMNIKASEERFRLAMSATHDGLYDVDIKNNAYWYSQTYIDLFAPNSESDWWENNLHPSDKEKILANFITILSGKNKNWSAEYRLKSKNGIYIHIEDQGNAIHDEQGELVRLVGAVADITERKKAEQLIKESELRLQNYTLELEEKVQERTNELKATVQQLVASNLSLKDQVEVTQKAQRKLKASQTMFSAISKNFPRGIVTIVDQDYRILHSKGEGLEIMGLNDIPFEGKIIDEIDAFSTERKSRLKQDIKKTLTGEHLSFEIEINNSSFSVNTTPLLDNDNKITLALLVYNDISQQKKVEQDILYALEKEQELNELKSRFVSMASHEFRTPLSTILSSASLIERQNEPGREDKRLGYVNRIKSGVKGLVAILNDFLSLSKLEEGKEVAKPEHIDIVDFSKTLIEEIAVNKKENQKIIIENNCKDAMVYLDPKLVRHILYNLLSNAIKYSPENKNIELSITTKGAQLCIEVRDYGIGIPEEEQKNLFNRFFRANNATNIQGTGLGLYIAKLYTELMKGSITFKSKPNVGTTFYVELPFNLDEK